MLTTINRLGLVRALAQTRQALIGIVDVERKVLMTRKADSLRAILTGQRTNSLADLDLYAVEDSVRLMSDYLDTMESAPELERISAGSFVQILADKAYRAAVSSDNDGGITKGKAWAVLSRAGDLAQAHKDSYTAAMAESFLAGGEAAVQAALERIEAIPVETMAALNADAERHAAYKAAWADASERLRIKKERVDVLYLALNRGEITSDEYRRFAEEYREAYKAERDRIEARFEQLKAADETAKADAQKLVDHAVRQLKQEVIEQSPVTQTQADDWAYAQRIESSAKTALKKIGYELPQLRADMAEFYRLTGGRLAKVRIKASRGRASATDIHGYKNRTINMGSNFSKRTLFHELGHHLEADPTVYAAAVGFLHKRRESDKLYSLKSLSGGVNYGPKEVAYKDSWYSVYVGKRYPYSVTEVISMGVEAWADSATLARVLQVDAGHMRLIAGFMKATPHELFGSVKKVFEQAADAEDAADEAKGDALEESLKQLAAGVEFEPAVSPEDGLYPYWIKSGDALIGTYKGLQVWQVTKLRDPFTKRQKKGIALVHWTQREGGLTSHRMLPTFDMTEAKAAARVWASSGEFKYLRDYKQVQQLAASYAS
jgi:hypothetical protein